MGKKKTKSNGRGRLPEDLILEKRYLQEKLNIVTEEYGQELLKIPDASLEKLRRETMAEDVKQEVELLLEEDREKFDKLQLELKDYVNQAINNAFFRSNSRVKRITNERNVSIRTKKWEEYSLTVERRILNRFRIKLVAGVEQILDSWKGRICQLEESDAVRTNGGRLLLWLHVLELLK